MDYNQEWLIANSRGSYSSSTVSFANTRTYHGLLVVSNPDRYERYVILSKLFEEITFSGKTYSLDTNYYPDTIYPSGYKYISEYSTCPFPIFNYNINGVPVKKSLVMDSDSDTIVIRYEFLEKIPESIAFYPLLAFRNFHSVIREGQRDFTVNESSSSYDFTGGNFTLHISKIGSFIADKHWYYNFRYPVEEERGTNSMEDLYNPGRIETVPIKKQLDIKITAEANQMPDYEEIQNKMLKRGYSTEKNPAIKALMFNSANFKLQNDIIAGFHWFGPWARDTFISMPGLLLIPKNYELARAVLNNYAGKMVKGLIPNNAYINGFQRSADASLWFIYALQKYYNYSGDKNFISSMYDKIKSIISAYIDGNDDFYVDGKFVHIKSPLMTWMDGKAGNTSFTPRLGKPVEINALWYNALKFYSYFSGISGNKMEESVAEILASFRKKFVEKYTAGGMIADTLDPVDTSFRPNFLLAYSLPYKLLDNPDFLNRAKQELATPYGIRTLSPQDPGFKGVYFGDQYNRDSAYHNGTIWPWLAGPYISAMVGNGENPDNLFRYFSPLFTMQYVPEIFDGLNPEAPKGCMMQAWSYGELIRAYYENLRPRKRNKNSGDVMS